MASRVKFFKGISQKRSSIYRGSREKAVTGGPFDRGPVVFAKTNATTPLTTKVKPICNIIRTFSLSKLFRTIPLKVI